MQTQVKSFSQCSSIIRTRTSTVVCLLMPDGLVCILPKLLLSWDFHAQQSVVYGTKWYKKTPENIQRVNVLQVETPC